MARPVTAPASGRALKATRVPVFAASERKAGGRKAQLKGGGVKSIDETHEQSTGGRGGVGSTKSAQPPRTPAATVREHCGRLLAEAQANPEARISMEEWASISNALESAASRLVEMEKSLHGGAAAQTEPRVRRPSGLYHTRMMHTGPHARSLASVLSQPRGATRNVSEWLTLAQNDNKILVSLDTDSGSQGGLPLTLAETGHARAGNAAKTWRDKEIPDFKQVWNGMCAGDNAVRALQGQATVDRIEGVRKKPPPRNKTNLPTERQFLPGHFQYHGCKDSLTGMRSVMQTRRIPPSSLDLQFLKSLEAQSNHPVSTAVHAQFPAHKDLLNEATKQIKEECLVNFTPRGHEKVFADKFWMCMKGEGDKTHSAVSRSKTEIAEGTGNQPLCLRGKKAPGQPATGSEARAMQELLEGTVGVGLGNALLRDERVHIEYDGRHGGAQPKTDVEPSRRSFRDGLYKAYR